MMKIGILGTGVVGSGVIKSIDEQFEDIQIVHIFVRDESKCKDERYTTSVDDLLDGIDCLLEMIVGINTAYEIIKKAMNKGIHVITSNKAVVCEHFLKLHELAKENNVQFRYEASVAGGIPWIQALIKAKRTDEISSTKGILNGTTNYILDKMSKSEDSFETCLKEAQELGYAESDPYDDIEGIDMVRKLMISSSLAYGVVMNDKSIDCVGLSKITADDISYFKSINCELKYIASSWLVDQKVYASVEPVLVNRNSMFASVEKNYNIVELIGDEIGTLTLSGQGAGQKPTANAMIQDLLDTKDKRVDKHSFQNVYEFDKTVHQFQYIVCFSKEGIDEQFAKVEKGKYRTFAHTYPMTPQERNEQIIKWKQFDEDCICVRKEVN